MEENTYIDFSYDLYKESVEPLIQFTGLRSIHLIIGYPPYVRISDGSFTPLSLSMEDDAGHTHEVFFNPITGPWFHAFLQQMFTEYFQVQPEAAEQVVQLYLSGQRSQQIFRLESGTLIYLRMDAGFSGSGMVLTAIPKFEETYPTPEHVLSLGNLPPGLILFTGTYGSGRSYSMYALLSSILEDVPQKVSIIEEMPRYNIDHLEDSLIMRRIAFDPQETYLSEIARAISTDVDIICLDDISDYRVLEAGLRAAIAGKTVIGIISAFSIQECLDSMFLKCPKDRQEALHYQLSIALRGIVGQQMIPSHVEQEFSTVPVCETIQSSDAFSKFLLGFDPKHSRVQDFMQEHSDSVVSYEDAIKRLLENQLISHDVYNVYMRIQSGQEQETEAQATETINENAQKEKDAPETPSSGES